MNIVYDVFRVTWGGAEREKKRAARGDLGKITTALGDTRYGSARARSRREKPIAVARIRGTINRGLVAADDLSAFQNPLVVYVHTRYIIVIIFIIIIVKRIKKKKKFYFPRAFCRSSFESVHYDANYAVPYTHTHTYKQTNKHKHANEFGANSLANIRLHAAGVLAGARRFTADDGYIRIIIIH